MKYNRRAWSYKIKMWFYRLTFKDLQKFLYAIGSNLLEIIMIALGFILLFIFPAFFH